jgi:PmbA protein
VKDLKALAALGLEWIRGQDVGLEAELYLSRGEERGLELREGLLDGVQQSSAEGAGLRLLAGERMAFASAGGLSLEAIQGLYKKASAELAFVEKDAHRALPEGLPDGGDRALEASLWDEALFTESWDAVTPRLLAMEAEALKDKRVSHVVRSGYSESRGEAVIANTKNCFTWERGGSCSVGLSTLSNAGDETQVGSSFQSSRRASALDFLKVGRESAARTTALLGSRKLAGGRRAVIFDPWVAGELLDLVASLLCADQVQRGKSLLSGKLGKKLFSDLVTLVDDPRMKGGMASSLYDDEGVPTSRRVSIEKGVVKEFFYDSYTAAREGRASNGCAGRGSYKGLPSPGSSNFYLEPGKLSREKLLADTPDGILVHDIMGMHMADPISGEFSVGVSGLAVVKGELAFPVKNAMISGNLVELLGRVDALASDLTFHGSIGAPTFRIADVNVA